MGQQGNTGRREIWIGLPTLLLAAAAILIGMGRVWWCACGSYVPWSWDIWSSHNSQHLLDPYVFTHILHGFVFYALIRWIGPKTWADARRILITAGMEVVWEIVENSPPIIARYRAATISLDYYGDSVLNSLSDILACSGGAALASAIPWWATLLLAGIFEVGMALWVRDGLILNLIMLARPVEAIKEWQEGLMPPETPD